MTDRPQPAEAARGADGPPAAGTRDAGGPRTRADSSHAAHDPAPSYVAAALVAVAGAAACGALAATPPAGPGARVMLSASVLLGAFDTLAAVLAARPGTRRTPSDAAALVVVAAPFHFAIAAAAGVPAGTAGFHVAWGAGLVGWSAVGFAASRSAGSAGSGAMSPRVAVGTTLAGLVCGLPLAAYGAAEFLGWRSRAPFLVSPLTGPAFLAHDGAFASAADAVWPLVAGAVMAAVALVSVRPRGARS